MNTRGIRSGFGILFLLSSAIAFVGLWVPDLLESFRGARGPEPHQFELNSRIQLPTAGPLLFRSATLELRYPSEIKENETRLVEATYSALHYAVDISKIGQQSDETPFREQLKRLETELKIRLSSSGFDIEPATELVDGPHTALPMKHVWTVTPKAEGRRYLLLSVNETKEGMAADVGMNFMFHAKINGKEIDPDGSGIYSLPVTVTTYWGLSHVTVSLIGFLFAGIGAVLTYPLVVLVLRRRYFPGSAQDETG